MRTNRTNVLGSGYAVTSIRLDLRQGSISTEGGAGRSVVGEYYVGSVSACNDSLRRRLAWHAAAVNS